MPLVFIFLCCCCCLVNDENFTVVAMTDRQGGEWGQRCWTTKPILCQAIYQCIDDEIKEFTTVKEQLMNIIKDLEI